MNPEFLRFCDATLKESPPSLPTLNLSMMPSVVRVYELGKLEHIFDKHNLKLNTGCCITLSSSQACNYELPLHIQDLDALISSGTWIAGTNRLRLHVELFFDNIALSDSTVSQAAEDLGVVLCKAEVL